MRSPKVISAYFLKGHGLAWPLEKSRLRLILTAERDLVTKPFSLRTFKIRPTVLELKMIPWSRFKMMAI